MISMLTLLKIISKIQINNYKALLFIHRMQDLLIILKIIPIMILNKICIAHSNLSPMPENSPHSKKINKKLLQSLNY
jgi:hypothetical protein